MEILGKSPFPQHSSYPFSSISAMYQTNPAPRHSQETQPFLTTKGHLLRGYFTTSTFNALWALKRKWERASLVAQAVKNLPAIQETKL